MKKLIEELRQKPEHDRRMIATSAAGSLVVVLLLGWGISTVYSFNSGPSESQTASVSTSEGFVVPVSDPYMNTSSLSPGYNDSYATTTDALVSATTTEE